MSCPIIKCCSCIYLTIKPNRKYNDPLTCKAFPNGIPEEVEHADILANCTNEYKYREH